MATDMTWYQLRRRTCGQDVQPHERVQVEPVSWRIEGGRYPVGAPGTLSDTRAALETIRAACQARQLKVSDFDETGYGGLSVCYGWTPSDWRLCEYNHYLPWERPLRETAH